MRSKTSRQTIQVTLFVAAVLVMCGFAAAANAQSSSAQPTVAIRFTLPFEVYWGTNVLPAGPYTMQLDDSHLAAIVQSANGKTAFFTPLPIRDQSDRGPAVLVVVARGNKRMVRSLNLPKSNMSLIYPPANGAEREILAKADHVREVPLTIAAK